MTRRAALAATAAGFLLPTLLPPAYTSTQLGLPEDPWKDGTLLFRPRDPMIYRMEGGLWYPTRRSELP